jgi:cellulose biosynthesis protein BcsQ
MTTHSESTPGRVVTFYSFKGGTGRTMALANVAWILAGSGKRVLAVDWDLEAPGLHSYFHPLLADPELAESPGVLELIRDFAEAAAALSRTGPNGASDAEPLPVSPDSWYRERARVDRYVVGLDLRFPGGGRLDMLPAGVQNSETYTRTVATFDWYQFWQRGGAAFLQALRDDMVARYDYVLIDSRTGLTDTAGICTVQLPDVVVDCFTLSRQAVNGAVVAAETVHEFNRLRANPIRILPVPMRVEDAGQDRLDAGRDLARSRFGRYLDWLPASQIDRYWGEVEIPYKPAYAYEEIPATVGDPAHQGGTLLAAFERLTGWITEGEVSRFPGMDESERRELAARYERAKTSYPTSLIVSYAAADRIWADWAAGVLGAIGYHVTLSRASADGTTADMIPDVVRARNADARVLVLLSRRYTSLPHARSLWTQLTEYEAHLGSRVVVPVRIDESPLPDWAARSGVGDLWQENADEAAAELRAAVGTPGDIGASDPPDLTGERLAGRRRSGGPRYPRSVPKLWQGMALRNAAFTGRSELLERIRDSLVAQGSNDRLPHTLHGLSGIGKSQIALEYAHRFAGDYDAVCWIAADEPARIRQQLADLAPHLQVPPAEDVSSTAAAVLERLRVGEPYSRWLLIYDNAEPDVIEGLLPSAGSGHVLITSRNPAWSREAHSFEVDLFSRDESVALMRRFNPTLERDDADLVAQELGDLPLAVGQAAAWLEETGTDVRVYLEQLRHQLARILDSGRGRHSQSAAATWLLALGQLRERQPAAAALMEVCAFFGPDPIPQRLFSTRPVQDLLTRYDPGLQDEMLMSRLYSELNRYGLARINTAAKTLGVHRLVQAVLREEFSENQQAEKRALVHAALAEGSPQSPDDSKEWEHYPALLRHLWPTGAERSEQPAVRLWICQVVRYLWLRGDYATCWETAERVLAAWQPVFGPDDPLLLNLQVQYANALRSGGRSDDAYRVDTEVLARAAASSRVGVDHPYAIAAAMGLGADLRTAGRYEEAVERDTETLLRSEHAFGDSGERTLMCATNLGLSLHLAGHLLQARERDEATWERNRELRGDDHLRTLASAGNLVRDLRATGEIARGLRLSKETLARSQRLLGNAHPRTLSSLLETALLLRRSGDFDEARKLAEPAYQDARMVLGPRHITTLALQVELAAEQVEAGEPGRARDLATDALETARELFGDAHPFTLACAANLAVYHRLNGDRDAALALSGATLASYEALLGDSHPATCVCRVNHATDVAEAGDLPRAVELGRAAYEGLRERVGPNYFQTLAAASNLALDLRQIGRETEARPLHEEAEKRARTALGAEHPTLRAIAAWRRLDPDIEPPETV